MARVPLTPVTPIGPYPTNGTVGALALNFAFAAADASNFNSFPSTGKEILLVQNSDASGHHFTITSAPDQRGRSADITSYAIGAGLFSIFNFASIDGWRQPDGNIYIAADDATVKFAVIRLP